MNLKDIPYLVHHFLENSAAKLPDKVALICGEERLSYREINEKADRLAVSLLDMGIKRQDRVIIFLGNSVEAVISLFGILKVGAIFVMLNPDMKARKLNYILQDSGAQALITHSNKARIIKDANQGAAELKNIVWVGKSSSLPASFEADKPQLAPNTRQYIWNKILSKPLTFNLSPLTFNSIDLDLATIIYTSGSTGEPKGVMSAHYNVISAARSISTFLENSEEDVILNVLPLSFDYGLYQVLMAFLFGGTVVLEKSFVYPYQIVERIVQEKATGFPIVPTMAAVLLQMQGLSKFDFGNVRYISNTAAALPVSHIKKLQTLFPKTKNFFHVWSHRV
jgi:acyl-CoA synthetase (AMP-forming)/AMP-acid ligase II